MTATDVEPTEPGETMPASHVEAHGHQHPTDRQYVFIALILGVITALEVGTYFLDDPSTTLLVATLFPMMIAKFAIVCGYFMHLRFDNPLFRRVFVFGLVLAVLVYVAIMMTTMEFWSSDYLR
jgi:cytochrome c oxidase subunit 4